VLFTSTAPLAGVATGGVRQLYMRDLAAGRTVLVSSSAAGVPANVADPDDRRAYSASLDGRYVVFSSIARNLVPTDSNGGARDVFRKDTVTGAISVVSRDARGVQPSGGVTGEPSISSDGSRVAFTSGNQPLVASDGNGVADIYLADLRARSLTLVSRSASGAQSPDATGGPAISADGRSVAFEGTARASVLAPGGSGGHADVYVARPASRSVTVASTPAGGGTGDGPSSLPSISGDGSRVVFSSGAALAGAAKVASSIESGVIVFIVCDGGWKYLSTGAYTDDLDAAEAAAEKIIYF
jgi:Tol biopolymer transport system component